MRKIKIKWETLQKKIKLFFYMRYATETKAWSFLQKQVKLQPDFSPAQLAQWEIVSKIEFTSKKYGELLQISFMKNNHVLSEYLLDQKNFCYPFATIPPKNALSKSHILDGFMTQGLLQEDHAAWLALMACHHPYHLLGFQKNYDWQPYYHVVRKFLSHKSFSPLFLNHTRQNLVLQHCIAPARPMLKQIFLDMSMNNASKQNNMLNSRGATSQKTPHSRLKKI